MVVDTYGEEKESRIKDTSILLTGGGNTTSPENMEGLYASVRSWGIKEGNDIPFIE